MPLGFSLRAAKFVMTRRESLLFGLTLPLRATRAIATRPRLLVLSALPVALTLALYYFGIARAIDWVHLALSAKLATLGLAPGGWAAWFLLLPAKIALWVAGALTFSLASAVIASPFSESLSAEAERYARLSPPRGPGGFRAHMRQLRADLTRTAFAAAVALPAILLSWVPVLNIALFVLACLLVSFQYVSYPQVRRSETIARSLLFLYHRFYAAIGFGLALNFLLALPVVGGLVIPLAVVGGTLLYAKSDCR